MTTMVVLAHRPTGGLLLDCHGDRLTPSAARRLYRASFADVCETVLDGDADLLVNYPDPAWFDDDVDPEAAFRAILETELTDTERVRYEVQVGESRSSRVGNALTHLLDTEDEQTVALIEPTVPLFTRGNVGTLAMKLRTNDTVLGPAEAGRVYLAGFADPIDFTDSFTPPAVETITNRSSADGANVEYLPMLPRIDSEVGLATTVSLVRSRVRAGRRVPPRTAAAIEDIGLSVDENGALSTDAETN